MTESEVYQKILKKEFKKMGVFFHRIESPKVPDIYLSKYGKVLWAELKCINKGSSVIRPPWRPGQLSWIKEHELYSKGSVCLILYYIGYIYWLKPKSYYLEEELECQKPAYLNNLTKPN